MRVQDVKLQGKKDKIKELKGEVKRLKEQIREKDRREIEAGASGLMPEAMMPPHEEQKEQFYRRDPTFHNEKTLPLYTGGSIETLIYLKNGHIAISGSC
jgi:hypothetical protein